jgi:hypothetical protein
MTTALHEKVTSGAPTGLAEHSEEVWAAWVVGHNVQ